MRFTILHRPIVYCCCSAFSCYRSDLRPCFRSTASSSFPASTGSWWPSASCTWNSSSGKGAIGPAFPAHTSSDPKPAVPEVEGRPDPRYAGAMNPTVTPHLPSSSDPGPRYWTREEYYRLADLGFFQGQRAERIGGQIIVMSPQNWPHTACTDKTWEALRAVFGSGFWVRSQAPLELGQSSDPEPDVSVVIGRREDYSDHPTTAVLVIEVSDTTLSFDRGDKANQYAAAGINDYWVIDMNGRRVEVYRDPRPDPAKPFGAWYTKVTVCGPADMITPLATPTVTVTVAGLLP